VGLAIEVLMEQLSQELEDGRRGFCAHLRLTGGDVEIARHWSRTETGRKYVAGLRELITAIRFLQAREGEGLLAAKNFGREANELRAGIEALTTQARSDGLLIDFVDLERLIDRVSARDSLVYTISCETSQPRKPASEVLELFAGPTTLEPCELELHLLFDDERCSKCGHLAQEHRNWW